MSCASPFWTRTTFGLAGRADMPKSVLRGPLALKRATAGKRCDANEEVLRCVHAPIFKQKAANVSNALTRIERNREG